MAYRRVWRRRFFFIGRGDLHDLLLACVVASPYLVGPHDPRVTLSDAELARLVPDVAVMRAR